MERRRLLVTGCGRSGTLYASAVWQAVGLDVRHEMPVPPNGVMGEDGIASWYMAVDDPEPPYGPSARGYTFDLVIHLVRNPLEVIPSVAQFVLRNPPSLRYIERNARGTRLDPLDRLRGGKRALLLQAARYWHEWNLLAEVKAAGGARVQVEALTAQLPCLCERLGVTYRPGCADAISRKTNARHHYVDEKPWTLNWPELEKLDGPLSGKVRRLASTYGY
jgi:hypothetical protein